MKAALIDKYGGNETVEVRDVPQSQIETVKARHGQPCLYCFDFNKSLSSELMEMYPAGDLVNSPKNDDSDLIKLLEAG